MKLSYGQYNNCETPVNDALEWQTACETQQKGKPKTPPSPLPFNHHRHHAVFIFFPFDYYDYQ